VKLGRLPWALQKVMAAGFVTNVTCRLSASEKKLEISTGPSMVLWAMGVPLPCTGHLLKKFGNLI